MKTQQALNTLLSVLVAAWVAEWADSKLGSTTEQIAQIELALVVILGGAISFALEALRAVALDATAARSPRLYRLLGGTLLALALAGCASSKSIPTSSDANVSAAEVAAKGGTIACAQGLSATLDPATGNVTSLTCAANGAWTDPPTAEETTELGKFGAALLDVVRLPLSALAAVGRALAGVAPTP